MRVLISALRHKCLWRSFIYINNVRNYSPSSSDEISHRSVSFPKLSEQEKEIVLKTFNECDSEQLLRYSVPKTRIKNVQLYRSEVGAFRSLDDLLEVDGLGIKSLEKICENIIKVNNNNNNNNNKDQETHEVKKTSVVNKKLKNFLYPMIHDSAVEEINTSVGIHVGPTGASWAQIQREGNRLSAWDFQNFSTLPARAMPTDIFKLAQTLLPRIPPGDIYVFEALGKSHAGIQSNSVIPCIQQIELSSMLLALLNSSPLHNKSLNSSNDGIPNGTLENKVYLLKDKLPARLFKTLIGSERVSSNSTILSLINNNGSSTSAKEFKLPCTPITLDQSLVNMYKNWPGADKELLGQSLMLCLAFMDLCVYRNPVTYDMVSFRARKSNK